MNCVQQELSLEFAEDKNSDGEIVYSAFIRDNQISIDCKNIGSENMGNARFPSMRWDVWSCTLKSKHGTCNIPFRMGQGHGGNPPSVADVLYCLRSDYQISQNCESTEDYIDDFGAEDYEQAEELEKACEESGRKLLALLGENELDTLMYAVEQL